jgi:hypothetical protein
MELSGWTPEAESPEWRFCSTGAAAVPGRRRDKDRHLGTHGAVRGSPRGGHTERRSAGSSSGKPEHLGHGKAGAARTRDWAPSISRTWFCRASLPHGRRHRSGAFRTRRSETDRGLRESDRPGAVASGATPAPLF